MGDAVEKLVDPLVHTNSSGLASSSRVSYFCLIMYCIRPIIFLAVVALWILETQSITSAIGGRSKSGWMLTTQIISRI